MNRQQPPHYIKISKTVLKLIKLSKHKTWKILFNIFNILDTQNKYKHIYFDNNQYINRIHILVYNNVKSSIFYRTVYFHHVDERIII